jgi:hypothetical protein
MRRIKKGRDHIQREKKKRLHRNYTLGVEAKAEELEEASLLRFLSESNKGVVDGSIIADDNEQMNAIPVTQSEE